jgi:hypothetical protein
MEIPISEGIRYPYAIKIFLNEKLEMVRLFWEAGNPAI